MAHLSDLLHDQRDHLYDYAKSVVHLLDSLRHDSDIKRIYTTKFRIKSYSSVRTKLLTHHRDENIHNDPKLTLKRLMEVIPDIIGVRVVCLFADDVERIVNHIVNRHSATRELTVLPETDQNGTLLKDSNGNIVLQINRYVYDLPLDDVPDDPTWQQAKRRDTGYTSVHLICAPDKGTRLQNIFPGLRCEIQIRTILEEAWAETSHYISYKKSTTDRTTKSLRRMMGRITPMNDELAQICDDATIDRNAAEYRYLIQVSKDYDFDPREDLGSIWTDQLAIAQEHRRNGEHGLAQAIHRSLRNKAATGNDLPEGLAKPITDVLECEMALDLLYLSEPSSLSNARKSYKYVISRDPNNFWARYRMAYILSRQGQSEDAERCCNLALEVLRSEPSSYPWLRKWWDTRGLELDVLAYLGTCIWQSAYSHYKAAWSPEGRKDEARYLTGQIRHKAAIKTVYEAIRFGESTPGLKESAQLQLARCHNNLTYYLTQLGDYEAALDHAKFVPERPDNPLYLHTLAWLEFKSPHGDNEKALHYSDTAIQLLAPDKNPSQASRKIVQLIQDHHTIITKCVRENAKYDADDEYWAWEPL